VCVPFVDIDIDLYICSSEVNTKWLLHLENSISFECFEVNKYLEERKMHFGPVRIYAFIIIIAFFDAIRAIDGDGRNEITVGRFYLTISNSYMLNILPSKVLFSMKMKRISNSALIRPFGRSTI